MCMCVFALFKAIILFIYTMQWMEDRVSNKLQCDFHIGGHTNNISTIRFTIWKYIDIYYMYILVEDSYGIIKSNQKCYDGGVTYNIENKITSLWDYNGNRDHHRYRHHYHHIGFVWMGKLDKQINESKLQLSCWTRTLESNYIDRHIFESMYTIIIIMRRSVAGRLSCLVWNAVQVLSFDSVSARFCFISSHLFVRNLCFRIRSCTLYISVLSWNSFSLRCRNINIK